MGTLGVLVTVLLVLGVEVAARRGERRRLALADRVDMEPVGAGFEAGRLQRDLDAAGGVAERRPPDDLALRVLELGPGRRGPGGGRRSEERRVGKECRSRWSP